MDDEYNPTWRTTAREWRVRPTSHANAYPYVHAYIDDGTANTHAYLVAYCDSDGDCYVSPDRYTVATADHGAAGASTTC